MSNGQKALKSGFWYTISNFIVKAISFLTTPIFARLLSKDDFGLFSNFTSWLSTLSVLSLYLGTTFISARFDYKDDFDGYVSSTLTLSTVVTLVGTVVVNVFHSFFENITGLGLGYINIMMLYILFNNAVDMFQTRERYNYEYKVSVFLGLAITFSTVGCSLLLVHLLENKLFGRIIGHSVPLIVIGLIVYIIIMIKGKKINFQYWKYALPIAVPFIPHCLSLTVLNSADKMMITNLCGPSDNAMYSIAYSCGSIISLLITSLNTAFSPFLGEKLCEEKYSDIYKISKKYSLLFTILFVGIMLLSPEALSIMGGKKYAGAIGVLPPVAMGCFCQFFYTLYVNVEQFKKKTIGMACASVTAALTNYVLNAIAIPKFGYIAAAYTTFISYLFLLILHILIVKRMKMSEVYPGKLFLIIVGCISVLSITMNFIYQNTIIRYSLLILYIVILGFGVYKFKDIFFSLLCRNKNE